MTTPGTPRRLRIGLLECDHVDGRYRGIAGDYSDMFRALLAGEELAGGLPLVELVGYRASDGTLPTSPGECDGWIITGSRRSVYEDEGWIRSLGEFVRGIDA